MNIYEVVCIGFTFVGLLQLILLYTLKNSIKCYCILCINVREHLSNPVKLDKSGKKICFESRLNLVLCVGILEKTNPHAFAGGELEEPMGIQRRNLPNLGGLSS